MALIAGEPRVGDAWMALLLVVGGAFSWALGHAVLYLGLVMTALGYGLWYSLVRRHPVSLIAPFLLLRVFSVLGSALFLGEALSWHTLIGGAIVIAGVAVILVERPAPALAAAGSDPPV